jgi:hypothetical protein
MLTGGNLMVKYPFPVSIDGDNDKQNFGFHKKYPLVGIRAVEKMNLQSGKLCVSSPSIFLYIRAHSMRQASEKQMNFSTERLRRQV